MSKKEKENEEVIKICMKFADAKFFCVFAAHCVSLGREFGTEYNDLFKSFFLQYFLSLLLIIGLYFHITETAKYLSKNQHWVALGYIKYLTI